MSKHDDQARSALSQAQGQATDVLSYLLAGPLTFGALGWLVDRWLGTSFLVAVGLAGGVAAALYVVWFRYGRSNDPGPADEEFVVRRDH